MKLTTNEWALVGAGTIILGASAPLLIPFHLLTVVGVGMLRRSAWLHQAVGVQKEREHIVAGRILPLLLANDDKTQATARLPTPIGKTTAPINRQRTQETANIGWFDRTVARLSAHDEEVNNLARTLTQPRRYAPHVELDADEQLETVASVPHRTGIYSALQTRVNTPTPAIYSSEERLARQPAADILGDDEERGWLGLDAIASKPLERLMSVRELCATLNADVDEYPHLVLFGDSGAGKTILAQLIVSTRPGKIVVLDPKRPKGWETAKWGGLPYVSRGKDSSYAPMVRALKAVVIEMDDRYARLEDATAPYEQLTVVLDEARNSVAECDELADLYKKIMSIGREVNVRLILLSTTDRVGPLGFDGEGDAMESLTRIRLGKFAVKVLPEVKQLGTEKYLWSAVQFGEWQPFDSSRTLAYVKQLPARPERAWKGVEYNCQTATPQTVIANSEADFLDGTMPVQGSRTTQTETADGLMITQRNPVSSTSTDRAVQGVVLPQTPIEPISYPQDRAAKAIRLLLNRGVSKNEIARRMGGSKARAYKEINRAIGR